MIQRTRLSDGRWLSYAYWGDPDGAPVLYFHGAMGSPLRRCGRTDAALAQLGVRYLLVDRPGFGASTPAPGRTLLGWADDVAELADHLSLGRFFVLGVSAGGPYAAAVGRALPERVGGVAVVSGLGVPGTAAATPPSQRALLWCARRRREALRRPLDGLVDLARRHPDALVGLLARRRGSDGTDLADPEAGAIFAEAFLSATERGVGAMLEDLVLATGPWGFDPGEVPVPVHVWHGTADPLVPVEQAWQLAIGFPRCIPAFAAGEGHFFFRRRMAEVLGQLVSTTEATWAGSSHVGT